MNLEELEPGREARVTAVDVGSAVMLRLMEMGLVPGARVCVKKRAPLGGPLQLSVGDYLLSIRRGEARRLSVEPLPALAVAAQAPGRAPLAPEPHR